MGSSSSILVMVSSFISSSLTFLLEVALLVVALTIVRKRRADAGLLIAASAGLQMVTTVTAPLVYSGMSRLTSGTGYREMIAVVQLGFSFFHAISAVLLILGIVRLAADPKDSRSPY
jgi:hypothetical protein